MPTVDAIATVVEDMARTLDFYRLLGFDIPPSEDTSGYVTIDLGDRTRFSWSTEAVERCINPGWERPSVPGRMGITLRCSRPQAVDATFHAVIAAGHTAVVEPFDAPWGARHCRFLDPDGNTVDLFAPLP
jgi:catechol 2,3-dioxygenase-like lactoylglutathione lyase family enzyme